MSILEPLAVLRGTGLAPDMNGLGKILMGKVHEQRGAALVAELKLRDYQPRVGATVLDGPLGTISVVLPSPDSDDFDMHLCLEAKTTRRSVSWASLRGPSPKHRLHAFLTGGS